MLPQLATEWNALEARRQAFLVDLAAMSPAALTFRPSPESWSLEDVAQHLWLVERGAVHIMTTRYEKPPLKHDLLSPIKVMMMRLTASSGVRIKAPVVEIVPKERMAVDTVRDEWDRTRATLRGLLERVTPDRVGKRIFRHPIFGPLTLAQSLEFVKLHHDHHLHQVRRIKAAAGFPR